MFACAPLAVGLHLATYHFDRNRGYEEFNPGVAVTCDDKTAGVYRNSEGGTSVYAAKVFRPVRHVDLALGLVAGYERSSVLPLAVPSVKFGQHRLSYLAPFKGHRGAIHYSLEF